MITWIILYTSSTQVVIGGILLLCVVLYFKGSLNASVITDNLITNMQVFESMVYNKDAKETICL